MPETLNQSPAVQRIAGGELQIRWPASSLRPPVTLYWSATPGNSGSDFLPLTTVEAGSQVTVADPSPGRRPYFKLVPTSGRPLTVAERRLPLEGDINFRDLGGYQARDGRSVKWGQLYRSGELGRLTDADLAYLETLNLKTVCDMRAEFELEQLSDRLPAGIESIWLPIEGGNVPMSDIYHAVNGGDLSRLDADFLFHSYRHFARDYVDSYATMLRQIATADHRPMVVHCTAGKDRTGLAAAILLWVLDVPMETVFEDYLLSNVYRAQQNEATLASIGQIVSASSGLPADQVDLSPMEALLTARREYLQTAVDTIEEDYGSINNYIRDGLGMDAAARQHFQEALLSPY